MDLAASLKIEMLRRIGRLAAGPWGGRMTTLPDRFIEQAGGTAVAASLDVTDPTSCAACFDDVERDLGPVDVPINNSGAAATTPSLDLACDDPHRLEIFQVSRMAQIPKMDKSHLRRSRVSCCSLPRPDR
jgi:NAD(P)-dependent dehydrogenase (short-subunit alcohol dehydrogenase family)